MTRERNLSEHIRASLTSTHAHAGQVGQVLPSISSEMLSDRYAVIEELGAGANGRVVAARDRILERVVAVKMLIQGDSLESARFIREARITAALEHPNIVPIHDLEFPAVGNINFIMRRVVGRTLGEAIERATAGEKVAEIANLNNILTVFLKVCDALARAHSRYVILQDVKPDNIMLGEHGEVALVDWGEATVSGEPVVGRPSQVVGTPIYMSPEQARGEPADERSDVYCLGASLVHTVLLRYPVWDDDPEAFWAKKRSGYLDLPTAEERRRCPRRLVAILLKAMAPAAENRYPSIQALANELTAFQAGQAVVAYHENPLERLTRWAQAHQVALAFVATIVLLAGVSFWWIWGERLKEIANWGTPIITEDFSDASWRDRWIEEERGMFDVINEQLVSTAPRSARIAFRQRLQTPLAIEYDGEILPDSIPCDLSAWWNEGPTPFVPPNVTGPVPHGYQIQAGAFSNQYCAIYRQEVFERLAQAPFKLQSAKKYHIRVEIEDTHIAMWIDGKLIVEHTDLFPVTSGYLALYAYFPGKAFDNVRIWKKGVAEKVSVLAIGDAAFQAGLWKHAVAQYHLVAESRAGEDIGNQACYREGLALLRDEQPEAAAVVWKQIKTSPERDFVACHALDLLAGSARSAELADQMIDLYRRAPWVRGQLRSQWMRYVIDLKSPKQVPKIAEAYLRIKEQAFPEETSTNHQYGQLLNDLERYQEVEDRLPNEFLAATVALSHLGRDADIIERFNDAPDIVADAQIRFGAYAQVIKNSSSREEIIVFARGKAGKIEEILRLYPTSGPALIAAGRAADVVQQSQRFPKDQLAALLALGQWQQAAEVVPPDAQALLLVGRDREALTLMNAVPPRWSPEIKLLLATIAGNRLQVTALAQDLAHEAPHYNDVSRWFGTEILPAFLAAVAGNPQAWNHFIASGSAGPSGNADLRHVYGQRLWFASALLRGDISEAQFLAQPTVSEAPALLLLLRGMDADVRGDQAVATTNYRAFKALPMAARLLDEWRPNTAAERLVTWRLNLLPK